MVCTRKNVDFQEFKEIVRLRMLCGLDILTGKFNNESRTLFSKLHPRFQKSAF